MPPNAGIQHAPATAANAAARAILFPANNADNVIAFIAKLQLNFWRHYRISTGAVQLPKSVIFLRIDGDYSPFQNSAAMATFVSNGTTL